MLGCVWLHTSQSFHYSVSAAFAKTNNTRAIFNTHVTWICNLWIVTCRSRGLRLPERKAFRLCYEAQWKNGRTHFSTDIVLWGLVTQGSARTLQMWPRYQHWAVCWICISWHYFVGPARWSHIQTGHCIPIKRTFHVKNTYEFSPYRAVNTLRLGYTNQSVNAV